ELAEFTGLSLSYLSLIERNKRDPSLSNLSKIAAAFELPPSILIFISTDIIHQNENQAKITQQMNAIIKDLFDGNEGYPSISKRQ
ncbi:MAG: helix-turn-helix transcriptional regulator, partial [Pseudomonadales bacterium]